MRPNFFEILLGAPIKNILFFIGADFYSVGAEGSLKFARGYKIAPIKNIRFFLRRILLGRSRAYARPEIFRIARAQHTQKIVGNRRQKSLFILICTRFLTSQSRFIYFSDSTHVVVIILFSNKIRKNRRVRACYNKQQQFYKFNEILTNPWNSTQKVSNNCSQVFNHIQW